MSRSARTVVAMKRWKGERIHDRLMQPVAGVEAEFSLLVDDRLSRPEDVFGDPMGFVTVPLLHRTGRSFHLPNGCAIYFDTGVIEIASPVMELERGCFGRLARSMDVAIAFVRSQLNTWERRTGRQVRLQGFSTHYNISVADGRATSRPSQHVQDMAWVLTHILPAPVMLLSTNVRSTGVGVRPRPRRIEVTADFPPDAARLAATGSVICGIVTAVREWTDLTVEALASRGVPVVEGFRPLRHSSRRGWLARAESYPRNPFTSAPNDRIWPTTLGLFSLRELARRITAVFRADVRRLADAFSFRVAHDILSGASPSWLDEGDRPAAYDDVGRGTPTPHALNDLGLARYEQVMLNAIEARPIAIDDEQWTPIAVRGWSRVVFRRNRDGVRTVLPIDTLADQLNRWHR